MNLPRRTLLIKKLGQHAEVFLFLLTSIIIQNLRTSIHVDEGRYLTAAYEMFLTDNYLIPQLNSVPYSHKPPLLFWLTNLMWGIFGTSEAVARFIPIVSTVLTSSIIRKLSGRSAQQIFLSLSFVTIWAQFYMFDSLMMLWSMLGWYALITQSSWILGLAVAGGLLTKGPVILIYLIPAAFFLKTPMITGFAKGLVIPLIWLGLVIWLGDPNYVDALLWKQTAGRLVNSFHHQRGWWFYPVIIPVTLIPWILHPQVWRQTSFSNDQKVILKSSLVSLLILQLISCKQIQYLLPMIPMLSIVISQRLDGRIKKHFVVLSLGATMGLVVMADLLIQKRYPITDISPMIKPHQPITVVTHRYRGELGFALRQKSLRVVSEDQYRQTSKVGQFIIYTEQPQNYPNPVYSVEQKSGHYLLIVQF